MWAAQGSNLRPAYEGSAAILTELCTPAPVLKFRGRDITETIGVYPQEVDFEKVSMRSIKR